MSEEGDGYDPLEARAALILNLRRLGITDADLLRAFETVPHEVFVPEQYEGYAYREASLPIACGQSITAPTILATMMAILAPQDTNKVLEVGTGSGYSGAILARMARRVFSLEKYRTLAATAYAHWQEIGISNIVGLHADGLEGLAQQAPFDRIFLTGSVAEPPESLLDQLADGGIAVMAVGPPQVRQDIVRIERADDVLLDSEHGFVRLPPLTPGRARTL